VCVASTYRVLALLAELGAVSEIGDTCAERAGGAETTPEIEARGRRYALCVTTGHHHHFTCRGCHATLDVASPTLETALAEIERVAGVRIERHDITLGGLCAGCQRNDTGRVAANEGQA
jgi:Fe2+ or Zn2+ uptake regulation protein